MINRNTDDLLACAIVGCYTVIIAFSVASLFTLLALLAIVLIANL